MRNKISAFYKKKRKILISALVIFSTFIFTALMIYGVYKLFCDIYLTQDELSFIVGISKDIFQILFFVIVGIVTILSYIQARKTLFTPIKTETFKMQIKAFEEILAYFQNKSEVDFNKLYDLNIMVSANAQMMFTDFVTAFHKEIKINEEAIKELEKNFPGAIISESYIEKNFSSLNYYEKIKKHEKVDITSHAIILEHWKKYEYGKTLLSRKYLEEDEKLNQLIASPLLPTELKLKLEKFDEIISKNIHLIGDVLSKIAQELPEKFPTEKSVENLQASGIWNIYNKDKEQFEPLAKEILTYIREYLKIDYLID